MTRTQQDLQDLQNLQTLGTISVVGWTNFQHYKDRDPPWIKLHCKLIDNFAYTLLQDASRSHLMGIWVLAARYHNAIPNHAEWIARRLQTTSPVDLDVLVAAGFITISKSVLATCQQSACLETETYTEETYTEETETETASVAAATKPLPKDVSTPKKPTKGRTLGPQTVEEEEFLAWVWARWLEVMGYQDRKLRCGIAREKIALARFREGHTREEFDAVLTWASTDSWMRGTDPKSSRAYDDFDTLFRPSNFDKYVKRAGDARKGDPRKDPRLAASDRPVTFERF